MGGLRRSFTPADGENWSSSSGFGFAFSLSALEAPVSSSLSSSSHPRRTRDGKEECFELTFGTLRTPFAREVLAQGVSPNEWVGLLGGQPQRFRHAFRAGEDDASTHPPPHHTVTWCDYHRRCRPPEEKDIASRRCLFVRPRLWGGGSSRACQKPQRLAQRRQGKSHKPWGARLEEWCVPCSHATGHMEPEVWRGVPMSTRTQTY